MHTAQHHSHGLHPGRISTVQCDVATAMRIRSPSNPQLGLFPTFRDRARFRVPQLRFTNNSRQSVRFETFRLDTTTLIIRQLPYPNNLELTPAKLIRAYSHIREYCFAPENSTLVALTYTHTIGRQYQASGG